MLKVLFNDDGQVIDIRPLACTLAFRKDGQFAITGKGINVLYVESNWRVVDVVRVCGELVAQTEPTGCVGSFGSLVD